MNSRRAFISLTVLIVHCVRPLSSNVTSEIIEKKEAYTTSLYGNAKTIAKEDTQIDQILVGNLNLTAKAIDIGKTSITKDTIKKISTTSKTGSKSRSFLIINSDTALRNNNKSKKSKKVDSLLYEERDEYGKKINTFLMKNMRDVTMFFEVYLDTEICHGKCEGD